MYELLIDFVHLYTFPVTLSLLCILLHYVTKLEQQQLKRNNSKREFLKLLEMNYSVNSIYKMTVKVRFKQDLQTPCPRKTFCHHFRKYYNKTIKTPFLSCQPRFAIQFYSAPTNLCTKAICAKEDVWNQLMEEGTYTLYYQLPNANQILVLDRDSRQTTEIMLQLLAYLPIDLIHIVKNC